MKWSLALDGLRRLLQLLVFQITLDWHMHTNKRMLISLIFSCYCTIEYNRQFRSIAFTFQEAYWEKVLWFYMWPQVVQLP